MAAKKKLLRGVALVEQVVARVESGDECGIEIITPQPLDVSTLSFSNGKPLPPSLRRWLAFDGSWLMRMFGWDHALSTASVSRLVKRHLKSDLSGAFRQLPSPLPQADAVPLDVGSETMRLLFLSEPDDEGEYPVLNVDVDDLPVISFESPGFDTWLAATAGIINPQRAPWSAVFKENRARVFGKSSELACTEFSDDKEEEDEAPPPRPKPASTPVVIKAGLAEDKLGKGLIEALECGDAARADAFFAAAKERFPEARQWGPIVLRHAVYASDADFARRLFAANVRPNAVGPYGALFENAAEHGSIEVVRAFLDAGAKVNLRSGSDQSTALIGACGQKRLDVATLLLDRGADPKLADNGKMTPLHHATSPSLNGPPVSKALCELLLDRGAEVDPQDGNGRTALHLAIEANDESLVDLLLERRANPDLQQWAGDTALTLAYRHRRTAMVGKLRAAGARSDLKNGEGWSVDDVALAGVAGPRHLEVNISCGPGRQTAELALEVYLGHATPGPDDIVTRFTELATHGCAGSDVHAPWTGAITMKGGGLHTGTGRWELSYEGVAPAAFALWLRALLAVGWTVRKLSLTSTGGGETTIDTERARELFANESLEPMVAWPDPGFPVVDKANGPTRFAWVSTKQPIDKDRARALVSGLATLFISLPRSSFGPESAYMLTAGGFTSAGFEIVIRVPAKVLVFPHDRSTARALLINALASLHRESDAIAGLEWGL